MNVGLIAKEWYARNEPAGALSAAILRCFFGGVIIRRPNFLLLGEPCRTDGKKLLDGTPANCWWIHFWTTEKGAMSSYDLCLEAPFPLEWVAFKRRGRIHIVPWEKLYWKDFKVKPKEVDYGRRPECPSAKAA